MSALSGAASQKGIEGAQAAESRLRATEARASDAEERFEQLNRALRRKLSAAAPPSTVTHKAQCLNYGTQTRPLMVPSSELLKRN